MKAKKSLGQHFLRSEKALRAIVDAGNTGKDETVIEIGPGTGVLTSKLLETGAKVLAVEKDDELFELLQEKYAKEISLGQFNLIHDDILNFEPENYKLKTGGYKIIANIPYNLTGIIIKKFLETSLQPKKIVLLLQKEVVERIIGTHRHGLSTGRKKLGTSRSKESILSVSVKAYGVPRFVETVRAGSFVPRPRVDSAIIVIEGISKIFFQKITGAVDPVDTECLRIVEKGFFEMVRAGFKSKRKKLSSNLSVIFSKEKVEKTFLELGLDKNLRAEDVGIEIWQKLAQSLLLGQE